MRRVFWAAVFLVGCAPPACSDAEERELLSDVTVLVKDDGPLADHASRRLARRGRDAIAHLETGLYQAEPPARRRIIRTLAATRSEEAIPILRHLAKHDPDSEVREAAERGLRELTPND